MVSSNIFDCSVQRTSSPASAVMRWLAASILLCVAAASSSRACRTYVALGAANPRTTQVVHAVAERDCQPTKTNKLASCQPDHSSKLAHQTPHPLKRTCFCAMAASKLACISSNLPCTVASSSSACCRSLVATLSSASDSRSFSILGSTTCSGARRLLTA